MKKVFIVDDSLVYRKGNSRKVTDNGFEIAGSAISAQDPITQIKGGLEYNILVTDYEMGGGDKNAPYLVTEVQEKTGHVPIILVSSHDENQITEGFSEFYPGSYFNGDNFFDRDSKLIFRFCHKERDLASGLKNKLEEITKTAETSAVDINDISGNSGSENENPDTVVKTETSCCRALIDMICCWR